MKHLLIVLVLSLSIPGSLRANEEEHHDEHEEHSDGLKISRQAEVNFDLKTIKLAGQGPWKVPTSARVASREEVHVFRLRDGIYKRVPFEVVSASDDTINVRSFQLQAGDQIVVSGAGFLRIAEISATEGAPAGHSH